MDQRAPGRKLEAKQEHHRKLINQWNSYRDKRDNVLQNWYKVGESPARCNFDQMEAKKIEEEMHVAVFLNTVKAPDQAKKFWEKRVDRAKLEKQVKTSVQVDKELERVAKKSSEEPKTKKGTSGKTGQ